MRLWRVQLRLLLGSLMWELEIRYIMDKTVAVKWMQDFDQKVEAEKDHLSELDGPIGDGDHGANLARGMAAAIEEIGRAHV